MVCPGPAGRFCSALWWDRIPRRFFLLRDRSPSIRPGTPQLPPLLRAARSFLRRLHGDPPRANSAKPTAVPSVPDRNPGPGKRPRPPGRAAPAPERRAVDGPPPRPRIHGKRPSTPPKPARASRRVSREDAPLPDSEFAGFGLDPRLLRALAGDLGFRKCTPVQALALPPCLEGKDVTGRAQTGTGKTAAFLVTIFQRLLAVPPDERATPSALIIAPTRELAIQIDRDAEAIGKYCGLRHLVVYGGAKMTEQRAEIMEGVHVLTATPGRLLDFVRRRVLDLSKVSILVIDEADRMLDMGFIPDVRRIVARLPRREKRQTLLFSATLTPDILRLAGAWMRSPVRIEIEPEQVVAREVRQRVYAVAARDKLALLLWLLKHEKGDRVLVFRNRRDASEELMRKLTRYGVNCELLSGDVPQAKRIRVLDGFREGRINVVVATDVAGRGIHVENISHVVNFDLPYEPEDYVHRIGRTGRAGVVGQAVSFACEEGAFVLPEIEKFIGRSLEAEQPTPEMLRLPPPQGPLPPRRRSRPPHREGGRDGHRSSGPRGGRRPRR